MLGAQENNDPEHHYQNQDEYGLGGIASNSLQFL
jgi:hypothetical protein